MRDEGQDVETWVCGTYSWGRALWVRHHGVREGDWREGKGKGEGEDEDMLQGRHSAWQRGRGESEHRRWVADERCSTVVLACWTKRESDFISVITTKSNMFIAKGWDLLKERSESGGVEVVGAAGRLFVVINSLLVHPLLLELEMRLR